MKVNPEAFGLADRIEMVEDVATGERSVKYNVIKEFAGKHKIQDMVAWFGKSPYRVLAIVPPQNYYSGLDSCQGAFAYEIKRQRDRGAYYMITAKFKQLYIEKLGACPSMKNRGKNET